MTRKLSPEDWQVPSWHDDYGDSRAELEELRSLAIAVRNEISYVSLELEMPEPGLMELLIKFPNQQSIEVHSIYNTRKTEGRRFAIFVAPNTAAEVEYYCNSVGDALDFISKQFRK